MSFTIATAMWVMAGTAAASAAVTYVNGEKQQGAARDAQAQALKNATAQADLADQANNRANAKKPNAQGLLSENAMAAKGGISGTMLTGPAGVDPNALQLGKTTLLGS